MESASTVIPSSNIPRQPNESNRNASTPSAPNSQKNDSKEMRQRLIEILSSTANGCLQELGYFPGMPAKLQELQNQNAEWKRENIKLWQDNKIMSDKMTSQERALSMLRSPEDDKVLRIHELESQNTKLKAQLESLKISMQTSQSGLWEQRYSELSNQHSSLVNNYNRAVQELGHLRRLLHPPSSSPHPPPLQQQQQQQQQQIHSHQDHNAYIQQQQQVRRLSSVPHMQPPSHPQLQHPNGAVRQIPAQQIPNTHMVDPNRMRRSESMQQMQQVASSSNRRASGSMIPAAAHPQIQHPQMQHHQHHQQQHPQFMPVQPSVSPQSLVSPMNLHHQYPNGPSVPSQHYPQPYQDPLHQMVNQRRPSNPNPNVYSSSQTAQPAQSSTFTTSNAPLRISAPMTAPPHVNSFANRTRQPTNVPPPQLTSQNSPALRGSRPSSSSSATTTTFSPSTTVSPYDIHLNRNATSPQVVMGSSPYIPALSKPPSPATTVTPVAKSVSPTAQLQAMTLKRNSLSQASSNEPPMQGANKRPRLDGHGHPPQNVSGLPSPITPSVMPQPATPATLVQQPTPTLITEQKTLTSSPQEAADNDDDEDDVVEVGPDGLRLLSDCLDGIFGDDRSGEVVCKFCDFRYKNGHAEKPVPFRAPSDAELEAHCVAEHSHAWASARAVDD